MMNRLNRDFYVSDDVPEMARRLLGKVLVTEIGGERTAGIISETEAYCETERACHAYDRRRTARTETLFLEGGRAYVYLCYGIHHLFNVVTGPENRAQAVLIRGVIPYEGIDIMLARRRMETIRPNLSSGPGTLSQALGITTDLDRTDLTSADGMVRIEDAGISVDPAEVRSGPRIGVDYAGPDAERPWRFQLDPGRTAQLSIFEKVRT